MKHPNNRIYYCKICKKEFTPNSGSQKFCSNNCIKTQEQNRRKTDKYKKYHKNYESEHREEHKKYLRRYNKQNKEKVREDMRLYILNRRHNDINFKILCNLRNRIWTVLNRNIKSAHTEELLSCSIEFLKSHLEKQFTKGMSWTNYGKWHVDHIKPCASFDLSKKSEQLKCFHYSNLQPLWKHDNLSKGAK